MAPDESARDSYDRVFDLLEEHHRWFRESLPLIASENVSSPAVREAVASDLGHRYAEGWVGERVYAGNIYVDQIEQLCIDLMKKLFDAEFVDVRPISGVTANVAVYTAFSEPGDTLMRDAELAPLEAGDILAMATAGAYALPMASNYNASLRPALVLVRDGEATLIRRRETYEDLMRADVWPLE